jgi:lipid-A-disaccharide synthase
LVVYTSSRISYEIARRVIQVPYISLVNLILDREAVPELIQSECNPERIDHLLTKIESDEQYRTQFQENYRELHSKLGEAGVSQRIADRMLELLGE